MVLYFAFEAPPTSLMNIALAEYVRQGGVLIYGTSDRSADDVTKMLQAMFPGTGVVALAVSPDHDDMSYLIKDQINNDDLSDDPIVNGPFGNLAGKYVADDNNNSIYVPTLPPGSVQICSMYTPNLYSGYSKTASFMWYNEDKNFFYIGDSVAATNTSTVPDGWPSVYVAATGEPRTKLYGRYAGTAKGEVLVYNAAMELNALAWAMTRAARAGINNHDPEL
jgi:hypothetical protein